MRRINLRVVKRGVHLESDVRHDVRDVFVSHDVFPFGVVRERLGGPGEKYRVPRLSGLDQKPARLRFRSRRGTRDAHRGLQTNVVSSFLVRREQTHGAHEKRLSRDVSRGDAHDARRGVRRGCRDARVYIETGRHLYSRLNAR